MVLSVAALVAVAILAGCGGDSKTIDLNCSLKLQGTARYNAVVDLYRRGELWTQAQLEKWARKKTGGNVPFLDDRGRIIPYEGMNDQQRLYTEFTLDATGLNLKVTQAVHLATQRAIREARKRCT